MKLIELFRRLKGYVTFEAVGGFSERFINLCTQKRIGIFDVRYINSHVEAKISPKSFNKLRPIVRKTGVRLNVINKSGLPFAISRNKHRVGLMGGVIFYCAFMLIMNRFLWCINSSGSEKYSGEQIMQAAYEVGVRPGVFLPFFDEKKAAREIYKYFDGKIAWVSVNVKGSMASIEVKDTQAEQEIEDENPCNIIADFDGVILSDETLSGIKNISKGNAVKKGDLLISGVIENEDSSTVYYKAKGLFTATHKSFSNANTAFNEKHLAYCESKSYIRIELFGLSIPLYFSANHDNSSDLFCCTFYAEAFGVRLPFSYTRVVSARHEKDVIKKENAFIYTCCEYDKDCYEKYKNTNILSYDLNIDSNSSEVKISGEYDCIDFIGAEQPILTEKTQS